LPVSASSAAAWPSSLVFPVGLALSPVQRSGVTPACLGGVDRRSDPPEQAQDGGGVISGRFVTHGFETRPQRAQEPCRIELQRSASRHATQPVGGRDPHLQRLAVHRRHETRRLAGRAYDPNGVVRPDIVPGGGEPPFVERRSRGVGQVAAGHVNRLSQAARRQLVAHRLDLLVEAEQAASEKLVQLRRGRG
jgi:hypothetical protein